MKRSPIKRTKKLKKRSTAPHARQRRICDYFFLTIIVLRDKTCFYCHAPAYTGHHIFAKGHQHRHLRYDFINTLGICETHHGTWNGVHIYPDLFLDAIIAWVDGKHGSGTYDRLKARAYMSGSSKSDLFLIEIMLWHEIAIYGIKKPDEWGEWSENKKTIWLRGIRKEI